MRLASVASLVFISAVWTSASAQGPAEPSPELKLLEHMVGIWDEVMTMNPIEKTAKAQQSTSITKKSWALGGRFLRMEGVWNPAKTEFISFIAYDPMSKEYRNWYFESSGGFLRSEVRGSWDEKSKTMTWASTDEAGNKTVGKTRIIDKDTHEWTVIATDSKGKVVLDLLTKNTRRKQ